VTARHFPLVSALLGLTVLTVGTARAEPAPDESPTDALLEKAEGAPGRSSLDAQLDEGDDAEPVEPASSDAGSLRWMDQGKVAPYLPPSHPAAAAIKRRQYGQARKLLIAEPQTPPIRYLAALSAIREHHEALGAAELSALAADYPELKSQCHFYAGMSLEKVGQWSAAASEFAQVEVGGLPFEQARWHLAKVKEQKKDLAGAMEALAGLWAPGISTPAQARAYWEVARLARKLGRFNAEHRALLAVWAQNPASALGIAARARLNGLPIPAKWRVVHAETLINQHRGPEALAELERILPHVSLPDEVACRARFAYGLALKQSRQHSRVVKELTPVVAGCSSPELLARARYVLAGSQAVVDPQGAVETYLSIARSFPNDKHAEDALIYASELLRRQGAQERALAALVSLTAREAPDAAVAKAWFARFWIERQLGKTDASLKDLDALIKLPTDVLSSDESERAHYWRGRTLLQLGRADEGAAELAELSRVEAASFYALMAREQVPAPQGETAGVPEGEGAVDVGPLAEDPHFRTGLELVRMGLPATMELLAVSRARLTEQGSLFLFRLLNDSGSPSGAKVLARSLAMGSQHRAPWGRAIWEAAFPQKYRNVIRAQSRLSRVDPALMQALVREESGFNPRAVSATGAVGLSQLMPETAALVGQSLNLSSSLQDLRDPARNVRLGSAYLAELLHRFDGNAVLAVASYNAGPVAVSAWVRRQGPSQMDEFVENIPLEETREYVKRVLGSYNTYAFLYAKDKGRAQRSLRAVVVASARP
jgi:soluble lytic murein transglycosylase